jgi:hypothetical protein
MSATSKLTQRISKLHTKGCCESVCEESALIFLDREPDRFDEVEVQQVKHWDQEQDQNGCQGKAER